MVHTTLPGEPHTTSKIWTMTFSSNTSNFFVADVLQPTEIL